MGEKMKRLTHKEANEALGEGKVVCAKGWRFKVIKHQLHCTNHYHKDWTPADYQRMVERDEFWVEQDPAASGMDAIDEMIDGWDRGAMKHSHTWKMFMQEWARMVIAESVRQAKEAEGGRV